MYFNIAMFCLGPSPFRFSFGANIPFCFFRSASPPPWSSGSWRRPPPSPPLHRSAQLPVWTSKTSNVTRTSLGKETLEMGRWRCIIFLGNLWVVLLVTACQSECVFNFTAFWTQTIQDSRSTSTRPRRHLFPAETGPNSLASLPFGECLIGLLLCQRGTLRGLVYYRVFECFSSLFCGVSGLEIISLKVLKNQPLNYRGGSGHLVVDAFTWLPAWGFSCIFFCRVG